MPSILNIFKYYDFLIKNKSFKFYSVLSPVWHSMTLLVQLFRTPRGHHNGFPCGDWQVEGLAGDHQSTLGTKLRRSSLCRRRLLCSCGSCALVHTLSTEDTYFDKSEFQGFASRVGWKGGNWAIARRFGRGKGFGLLLAPWVEKVSRNRRRKGHVPVRIPEVAKLRSKGRGWNLWVRQYGC